jgi:hypothetical protein
VSTPYIKILNAIVDHLRVSEPFNVPPTVLVLPEADEPSDDRPGQGDSVSDMVNTALERAGVSVVVYLGEITATEQSADLVTIHVQVVELVENNRSTSGSNKPNLQLIHAARSALEGQQFASTPEWTELAFIGIETISVSGVIIREVKFQTMTLMSSAI